MKASQPSGSSSAMNPNNNMKLAKSIHFETQLFKLTRDVEKLTTIAAQHGTKIKELVMVSANSVSQVEFMSAITTTRFQNLNVVNSMKNETKTDNDGNAMPELNKTTPANSDDINELRKQINHLEGELFNSNFKSSSENKKLETELKISRKEVHELKGELSSLTKKLEKFVETLAEESGITTNISFVENKTQDNSRRRQSLFSDNSFVPTSPEPDSRRRQSTIINQTNSFTNSPHNQDQTIKEEISYESDSDILTYSTTSNESRTEAKTTQSFASPAKERKSSILAKSNLESNSISSRKPTIISAHPIEGLRKQSMAVSRIGPEVIEALESKIPKSINFINSFSSQQDSTDSLHPALSLDIGELSKEIIKRINAINDVKELVSSVSNSAIDNAMNRFTKIEWGNSNSYSTSKAQQIISNPYIPLEAYDGSSNKKAGLSGRMTVIKKDQRVSIMQKKDAKRPTMIIAPEAPPSPTQIMFNNNLIEQNILESNSFQDSKHDDASDDEVLLPAGDLDADSIDLPPQIRSQQIPIQLQPRQTITNPNQLPRMTIRQNNDRKNDGKIEPDTQDNFVEIPRLSTPVPPGNIQSVNIQSSPIKMFESSISRRSQSHKINSPRSPLVTHTLSQGDSSTELSSSQALMPQSVMNEFNVDKLDGVSEIEPILPHDLSTLQNSLTLPADLVTLATAKSLIQENIDIFYKLITDEMKDYIRNKLSKVCDEINDRFVAIDKSNQLFTSQLNSHVEKLQSFQTYFQSIQTNFQKINKNNQSILTRVAETETLAQEITNPIIDKMEEFQNKIASFEEMIRKSSDEMGIWNEKIKELKDKPPVISSSPSISSPKKFTNQLKKPNRETPMTSQELLDLNKLYYSTENEGEAELENLQTQLKEYAILFNDLQLKYNSAIAQLEGMIKQQQLVNNNQQLSNHINSPHRGVLNSNNKNNQSANNSEITKKEIISLIQSSDWYSDNNSHLASMQKDINYMKLGLQACLQLLEHQKSPKGVVNKDSLNTGLLHPTHPTQPNQPNQRPPNKQRPRGNTISNDDTNKVLSSTLKDPFKVEDPDFQPHPSTENLKKSILMSDSISNENLSNLPRIKSIKRKETLKLDLLMDIMEVPLPAHYNPSPPILPKKNNNTRNTVIYQK